jgi:hypothetical protein
MSAARTVRWFALPAAVLLLVLAAALLSQRSLTSAPAPPPPEVQGQSFAVTGTSPLIATGVHPADVLGAGGIPLIPCANLGLLCTDPATGANDEITGLSYGWDFFAAGLPPVEFSVDQGSRGMAGTAVRVEANCNPAQPQADVFGSWLDRSNQQILDGDGVACSGNSGFALGLTEGAPSDNLDNLDRDPCQFVDLNCDGVPEDSVFFTLAPGSPSLGLIGATSADILRTSGGSVPVIWAAGATDLGLQTGDVIDALCIREDGNAVYGLDDEVLFSLAPGSPTLARLSAGPADLLRPHPPRVIYTAAMLGLEATDNVNALLCAFQTSRLWLPLIKR